MSSSKTKSAKIEREATALYASVWDAIADTPEQAANLRARAELVNIATAIVYTVHFELQPA